MKKLLYILALVTTISCTTTKYVEVPVVHEKFIHTVDTIERVDSVINTRTTIVREVDSLTLAQYGIQLENQRKAFLVQINDLEKAISKGRDVHVDTVVRRDSIPYPVEVIKEVRKGPKISDVVVLFCLLISVPLLIGFFSIPLRRKD